MPDGCIDPPISSPNVSTFVTTPNLQDAVSPPPLFEHIAPVGRPSSPFFYGILGRALARLGDTGGRYCRLWHLRGNVSMSPLAAPMPPGLSWSSPTCLCTPEIAAPSPPGGRWLSISLHAAMQP
eukprot:SAG25_NODE_7225_length_494_cov_152.055696_1_plen_123_part_01